ncbi:MAG: MBL fold metallo-hydrolase [Bacteroidota bacterium]|jgi:L-ascorbate metabolism protein UlaG (beta-lactamase superfamily)
MDRRSLLKKLVLTPFVLPSITAFAQDRSGLPPHHGENGFINTDPDFTEAEFTDMAPWILKKLPASFSSAEKVEIPYEYNDGTLIGENRSHTVTWIGHSTALIQMEGKTFLTDPVWSSRVGPFRWAGTARISEPGLEIEKLPPIDFILISHNHYDHLDESSIEEIVDRNPNVKFFVPLRVRDWFEERGIRNVEELDWWEGASFNGLKIICTPAQHFSGRWLNDRNQTLWCSWTVLGKKRLYFGGDSGYCSHFKNIGAKFGPFDLTMIPIGAYAPEKLMKPVHMGPDDAVQTFLDLRGKKMLAIHWGAYVMTDEPMDEPPKRLAHAVAQKQFSKDDIWVLKIGETKEW